MPSTTLKRCRSVMALLESLRAAGFELEADHEYLTVRPAQRLTPEIRTAIREHKDELLKLLRQPMTEQESRLWVERHCDRCGKRFRVFCPTQSKMFEELDQPTYFCKRCS